MTESWTVDSERQRFFTGYATRAPAPGSGAIGRNNDSMDTDTAADWRPQATRTMGVVT